MPNHLFSETQNPESGEWKLLHDLIHEAIQTFGYEFYYIPKDITTQDDILGEDVGVNILNKAIPMYFGLLNYQNFDDAGSLFGKFGINVTDKIKLVICQDDYQRLTGIQDGNSRLEDILYAPHLKRSGKAYWSINSINLSDDGNLLRFGDNHVYIFGLEVLKHDSTDKLNISDDFIGDEINAINDFKNEIVELEQESIEDDDTTHYFNPNDPFNEAK